MNIQSRVDLGIQLLDNEVPGWQEKVDPAILDIGDMQDCPLAQIFGGYWAGAEKLDIWGDTEAQTEFGFDGSIVDRTLYDKDCKALTEEWKRRLARSS